tara:strand:- start:277 stop:480 length:204 start_codon:yes stop_codon:yes gene_type:complete
MTDEKKLGELLKIDITPDWAGIMPGLIAVLENGTNEGKKMVREELMRLARAVDALKDRAGIREDDDD